MIRTVLLSLFAACSATFHWEVALLLPHASTTLNSLALLLNFNLVSIYAKLPYHYHLIGFTWVLLLLIAADGGLDSYPVAVVGVFILTSGLLFWSCVLAACAAHAFWLQWYAAVRNTRETEEEVLF